MLVEVTLLRFRSVLGKWAPDSIAETTLFNVTTVPWKFRIICYVVPSMFMTANPSSSKLYVNLYVSFMTHGSHKMSWNAMSMFLDTRAHAMDTILKEKITSFNTCLQSRVDTLHVNQAPSFLYPCVRWAGEWLPAAICMQSCISSFHSWGPSGVTEWRFLVALCPLLPKWDWIGVSLISVCTHSLALPKGSPVTDIVARYSDQ